MFTRILLALGAIGCCASSALAQSEETLAESQHCSGNYCEAVKILVDGSVIFERSPETNSDSRSASSPQALLSTERLSVLKAAINQLESRRLSLVKEGGDRRNPDVSKSYIVVPSSGEELVIRSVDRSAIYRFPENAGIEIVEVLDGLRTLSKL